MLNISIVSLRFNHKKEKRQLKRKIVSGLMLTLLLIGMSTLAFKIEQVSAVISPYIAVDPDNISDPTLTPGENFTVDIITDYDGSDVWAWEFSLTYDPSILNGVACANGDLISIAKSPTASFMNGTFDNVVGKLSLTGAFFFYVFPPIPTTSGPGTLATVTFTVVGYGISNITLGDDTVLKNSTDRIIDAVLNSEQIGHGYFSNVSPVGWINGTVTNASSGDWIEGATVSADGVSDVTDASGFYIIEVSPETYDVTAAMTGYDSQTVMDVIVSADETVTQDFALVTSAGDVTPPTITINEPMTKDYLHSETITLDFSAVDTESGVKSISATLGGETFESGDSVELFNMSLGTHTLTVTAVDNAGNSDTKTVTFNVIATIDSLIALVEKFHDLGYINDGDFKNGLLAKLYAAKAKIETGQAREAKNYLKTARNILNAFINQVKADDHVAAEAVSILISDVEYVQNNL